MRLLPVIAASLLLAAGCRVEGGCSGATCGTPPAGTPGGTPAPSSSVCPPTRPEWEVHASDVVPLDGALRFDGSAAALRAPDAGAVVVGTTVVERAGSLAQGFHAEIDGAGQETRTTYDLGYKRWVPSAGFADDASACLLDGYPYDDLRNRVLRIDAAGAMEWATAAPDVVAVTGAADACLAAGYDDTAAFATALGAGGAIWRRAIAPVPPATTSAAKAVARSGADAFIAGVDSIGPFWTGNPGDKKVWVERLDATGAVAWRADLGLAEGADPVVLAAGPGGEVYVSGWRVGCFEVGAFVAKLRPDGSREWLRTFEKNTWVHAMAVDGSGDAWIVGSYLDAIAIRTYAVVARIDPAGGLRWARRLAADEGSVPVAEAIAFDAHGNGVVAGTTAPMIVDREGFLVGLDAEGRRLR